MRLGADRDGDDGDVRTARRRTYRVEHRDWYAPDDVSPYSMPHRPRIDEVQRPDDRPARGHGRSTRSLDASQPTMPPRLTRSSTDAYRRPAEIIVYEEVNDDHEDGYRRSRRRARSPEYERGRRPGPAPVREQRPPSPVSVEDAEDDDDDDEEEHDDEEEEEEEEAQIEVVEEVTRHRRHGRHRSSRDEYSGSSESRRHRERQRAPSPSSDEEDEFVQIPYRRRSPHRRSPDHRSPVRRPSLRREVSDSPRHSQRYSSIIENSRPPVASRRSQKVYESREIVRERPRRSEPTNPTRHSRSSSRRPPSILGSIFGGSSSRLNSPERPPKQYECVVCMGEYPANKCAKLKCGHRRCHSCLRRQFKMSITDPQEMPPKCCTTDYIPIRHVDKLFDDSFKRQWNHKFAEYSTRNRVYCPSRGCGEWIRPRNIHRDRGSGRKQARCGRCDTKVCVSCNGRWHRSRDCPQDEETARFLKQAKAEGWQRCYRCKIMVELKEGCNHMTCRCGAEFCMICGVKWKNCECPWFSYDSADDQLEMNIPTLAREAVRDVYAGSPPSPSKGRAKGRARARSPYDEEAMIRRLQNQRNEDLARRTRHREMGDYDVMGGVGDVVGIGNTAGHFMNDHYRRGGRGAPPPPPPGLERTISGVNYVPGIDKTRGLRGGSMERRLADRFSENRQMPGPMPPPPPPPANIVGPPMVPPPMGMPGIGMPPGPPMGEAPIYAMRGAVPVVVERDANAYEDDGSYGSRGRRRHRRKTTETELPKSSTLAGLGGRGVGMGRVDVWRKWVQPGAPVEDVATPA